MLYGNINLINTTDWNKIDILFITPQMLEYVLASKDEYDYFDINPEIIMVDDFDYIFKYYNFLTFSSSKYDLKKCLNRFFSLETKFGLESIEKRKLVLSSSSIQMDNIIYKTNYLEKITKSLENYKNYLININKNLLSNLDVVVSPYFMNLEYHIKGIKVILKTFESQGKILLDKKLKHMQSLIDATSENIVICCNDSNIAFLKDFLKRRRLQFTSVDESDRVGQRLFSIMLYNKYEYNILIITPIFLKSLNIVKINQMILFDYISDQKDFIRILAKFPKVEEDENVNTPNLHIFLDNQDTEKNTNFIDYLNKLKK